MLTFFSNFLDYIVTDKPSKLEENPTMDSEILAVDVTHSMTRVSSPSGGVSGSIYNFHQDIASEQNLSFHPNPTMGNEDTS